ncbi:hypothetical protein [Allorhizocola rhizosphaerae]|uniref:hypothetical protein n=1 Tax=Allorhizocola rhizosphaerae TaxID=1872709 RepID=UPI0013C3066B|nr:hypothetical protein [Allorhizocola rhizosphaerae]
MRGLLACLTITALVGACAPKAGPTEAGPSPVTGLPSPTIINQHVAAVDVPSDFDGVWLEFASVKHGYAMFSKYSPDRTAEARLFSTVDGGMTWTARPHPQPIAKDQQMYVIDARTVSLQTGENEWHVSTDGMASWQRGSRYGYALGDGPFYVDCHDDDCLIRSHAGSGWQRALPNGHDSGVLTNIGNGRYWLASVHKGAPVTQLDGKDVKVPAQEGRRVFRAQVMVSQDGADTWLLADQDPLELASGPTGVVVNNSVQAKLSASVVAGMKGTGLPLIWRLRDGVWVAHPTTTIKEKPNWPYSVVSAGGGVLVIAGPEGPMYFTDSPASVADLPRLDWVGQTRDGTLFARPHADQNTIYLSAGTGQARQWIRVTLSRS